MFLVLQPSSPAGEGRVEHTRHSESNGATTEPDRAHLASADGPRRLLRKEPCRGRGQRGGGWWVSEGHSMTPWF